MTDGEVLILLLRRTISEFDSYFNKFDWKVRGKVILNAHESP